MTTEQTLFAPKTRRAAPPIAPPKRAVFSGTEAECAEWLRSRGYTVRRPKSMAGHAPMAEHVRLSPQCRAILDLLEERGSAGVWNIELVDLAIKYTSRISDLRRAGHRVDMVERQANGQRRYVLRGR